MADKRINALANTASSTASDDFIAVDGTTNGTRKLNAFSPTFGGNATVTGTLTVNGSSPSVFRSLFTATRQVEIQIPHTVSTENYLRVASNNGTTFGGDFGYGLTAGGDPEIRFNAVHGGAVTNWLTVRTTTALPSFPKAVSITDTTASTTTSTGALVVGNGTSGGLGVGGAINAGGLILSSGSTAGLGAESRDGSGYRATWYNPTGDDMQLDFAGIGTKFTITSAGNTTIAGTLTVNGGTGSVTSANGTTDSLVRSAVGGTASTGKGIFSSYLTGLIEWQFGGLSSDSSFRISSSGLGTSDRFSISSTGVVSVLSTTASTSTSSGALVVSGGVGVAGAIWAGDNVTVPNSKNFVVRNAAASSTAMRMYADSSDFGYIDCTANTELRLQVGSGTKLSITNTGNVTTTGNITTAAPSGGTAAAWKLGTVAAVSPTSPNRTIEVDIGGTIYYIHAKTTNN